MSINQLKIVVSILKEVSEDNTPTAYDYGITKEKYYSEMDNYIRTLGFVKHMRNYCDFLTNQYQLNLNYHHS